METTFQNQYKQALAYLTINSSFVADLGLFHGRMGIVLFFAHYGRAIQDKRYEDFAGDLLDEIYEEIHVDMPVNLENGLCGIGWGIEYLVQQGFMEGNTDEILADIDRKVMEIDPLRMTDLSFQRGLAGIAFYVIARLNAHRETTVLPFDGAYLHALQQALRKAQFAKKDVYISQRIKEAFFHSLKGAPDNCMDLSFCQKEDIPNLSDVDFTKIDNLGMSKGLARILWHAFDSDNYPQPKTLEGNPSIFLFDEKCRGQNYGIGTYVNQLTEALKDTRYSIFSVHLKSGKTHAIEICKEAKVTHICIGEVHRKCHKKDWNTIHRQYYRSVSLLLSPFLKAEYSLFHMNYIQMASLADYLKEMCPHSQAILTVHYTDWSFALLGNHTRLQEILDTSLQDDNSKSVVESIENWRKDLKHFDRIIAIAKHSYLDLIDIYQVPEEKLICIPHGLEDKYSELSVVELYQLRQKFGFTVTDKILIFAGRLDAVKGLFLLSKAFHILKQQYPELRLIIAGDGNYKEVFENCQPEWAYVTFTGFVDKPTLYELYSISDIGVLPSLHEEFGFVALEMMMMEIPLIAGDTSGLSELVVPNKTGVLVKWENMENKNINHLADAIAWFIKNPKQRQEYAKWGRKRYLNLYNDSIFREQMLAVYSGNP